MPLTAVGRGSLPCKDRIENQVVAAYDLWSDSYDSLPDSIVLDADATVFHSLLPSADLVNKKVADVGCGTGRYWNDIHREKPMLLFGFDVSGGMLSRLQEKYPGAAVKQIVDNEFEETPGNYFDVIISTLTIGHLECIRSLVAAWDRILRPGGRILITDFHPESSEAGRSRVFGLNGLACIKSFIHPISELTGIFIENNFSVLRCEVGGGGRTASKLIYGLLLEKDF